MKLRSPMSLRITVIFTVLCVLLRSGLSSSFAEPTAQMRDEQIISKIPRPLPGQTLVRETSLHNVLNQIVLIGLQQRPQCSDYQIESRIIVAPETLLGGFEEVWTVSICGEETKFQVVRSRLGHRIFSLAVKAMP